LLPDHGAVLELGESARTDVRTSVSCPHVASSNVKAR
jgi:hypothetical protein